MTQLTPELTRLGDVLEQAATANLGASIKTSRAQPRRARGRVLVLAATLVIALAATSALAAKLLTGREVSDSIVAGALILQGSQPTCTPVTAGSEYRCTLDKPPFASGPVRFSDVKGLVAPTVDATHHVNGGCRALSSDGVTWECYVGQAAVDQRVIDAEALGEYAPGPGIGAAPGGDRAPATERVPPAR